ncbi:uncharacterized protein LTR77_008441 [Saxophila tyrrhenica]|uniref:Wax synthase domain-containing protein n=1 Tax=Saxophila tyrrhenica TaxID=1690608 RepID=A0AAV9P4M7_9PEZI|nr:hypothetical protein LTR77_008441 [Saxophila tyrrhenica]
MLPPNLTTPRQVTLYYDSLYDHLTSPSGGYHPFLYPWAGLGAFLVLAYLLIDHRQSRFLTRLRYPIAAFLVVFQAWCVLTNKARHPAAAFGVGLLSAWGVGWVSTLVVVNDCQREFWRVERREVGGGRVRADGDVNGMATGKDGTEVNGSISADAGDEGGESTTTTTTTHELYCQHYPSAPFTARLDWVADLFCSFRGVGWSFQSSTVPPLPSPPSLSIPHSISHTPHPSTLTTSRTGIRRLRNRSDLLRPTIRNLIIGYLALDAIKVVMHHDPYFWGYTTAPAPTYLPLSIQHSATLTRSYRLLISLAGIYTALWEIFRLGPAFFCLLLGPKYLGIRGEAWMNPADMYGAFSNVLNDGLAGWWGGWWHQVFRVAFEQHSKFVLRHLNIEAKSQKGRLVGLCVAFFMSGCLHACGSYTQLGETRPLMGPMRFFLLQGVGIVLQTAMVGQLKKAGVVERVPRVARQVANFVFVHVWLYYTAPLLVDDFAKGGVWLFEPVALSPLRAMGLGAKDDRFFCWWDGIIWWRSGRTWWESGIAI